ncbi:fimbrial biogenesis chaperone, partial [Vibrio sp. V28_P6S34P95]|uniref:fimbrial biogenesis chaperone n=2 Tax=unclassified Vibrio TaxID=2614977 RepID=UPI001372595D
MKYAVLWLLMSIIMTTSVSAGVTLEGTRIIFDAERLSQSVLVVNTNDYDVVVQSWVDNGDLDNQPESAIAPVITKPALFTLKTGQSQVIQLVNVNQVPIQSEQLYWLNLYELPPVQAAGVDKIVLTMQTQYKLFYRYM